MLDSIIAASLLELGLSLLCCICKLSLLLLLVVRIECKASIEVMAEVLAAVTVGKSISIYDTEVGRRLSFAIWKNVVSYPAPRTMICCFCVCAVLLINCSNSERSAAYRE